MQKTYRVVDLQNYYCTLDFDTVFLVLSNDEELAGEKRKIKMSNKCYLELNYQENEDVCIIFVNKATGAYEEVALPCVRGIYKLSDFLKERDISLRMSNKDKWPIWGNCCHINREETLVVSDNAVLIDGVMKLSEKELVLRDKNVIEGTNVSLSYVGCFGWDDTMDTPLFEKCLQGMQLSGGDFSPLINHNYHCEYLLLDFGLLHITIRTNEIEIRKRFSDYHYVSEEFICYIAKERIMIPDMFFEFVLRAETKKQLLSGIGEYFFGES